MTDDLKTHVLEQGAGSATPAPPVAAADQARELAIGLSAALHVAGLLAAPRLLAKAIRTQKQAPAAEALAAVIENALTTFRSSSDATGLVASLEELRARLVTWEGKSPASEPIVEAARRVLRALNVGEPDEGWDRWEGALEEQSVPPAWPTLRILRADPMTLEAWLAFDGPGELCDGVLVEEKTTTALEEAVASWFLAVLRAWASPRGGVVYGRGHKLVVSTSTGRKPDVCIYMPNDPPADAGAPSTPVLVLEVVSASRADHRRARLTTSREYGALGVRWYWIVDALKRTLEVLELGSGGRYIVFLDAIDGTMSQVGLEGLAIDLDALWAAVASAEP
ncbi:Uma2 family endonuclease [Sorangium sp. So ce764]|uniref:Uma2 family endonuclease n=1 Tax=Sorangium sp. So ce764 TaxID=3133320 RepID=UPI003F61DC2D